MMSASASGPTLPERWCHAIALDSSSAAPPSEEAEFKDEVLALESIFDNALAAVDPPSAPRSSASGLSVDTSLPVPPHLLCARSIAERTGKRAFCLSVAPFAEGEGCDDDDDDKSQVTFLAPQFESGAGVRAVFAPHATALAPFSLTFAPCAGYPSKAPPRMCVSAPWLPRGAARLLERELRDSVWRGECGQSVCIFACADFLRTRALGLLLSAPVFSLALPPNTPTRHVPIPERARLHRPPPESIIEREGELRCLLLEAHQTCDLATDEWSPSRCCEPALLPTLTRRSGCGSARAAHAMCVLTTSPALGACASRVALTSFAEPAWLRTLTQGFLRGRLAPCLALIAHAALPFRSRTYAPHGA